MTHGELLKNTFIPLKKHKPMKRAFSVSVILLFLLGSVPAFTQESVTVTGRVTNADNGKPVENVNVMLCRKNGRSIYNYSMTDADGMYTLRYVGREDTLAVRVSGFDIREQVRLIPVRSTRVDFAVQYSPLKIREVVVKARPVERKKDTVVYYVEQFKEKSDRSIGEVLRKMPGIEVGRSGNIRYNGEDIGKMYIEGLDMLESRYGLATNSVKAEDIAAVEILENHQPVKMNQGKEHSGKPAVNLRLKEQVRGTWGGHVVAGGGYKPAMWYGEAAAMYFSRQFQTMNTYKTNNTGDDVSEEVFGGRSDADASMLGVKRPSVPPFEKNRYMDNRTHMVSANTIVRLREDLNLRANVQYQNEQREDVGTSVTTYHLAGENREMVIDERVAAQSGKNRLTTDIDLESNTREKYFTDKLSFSGLWWEDFGSVRSNGTPVEQSFRLPNLRVGNRFRFQKRKNKVDWNISSNVSYTSKPESLTVTPLIYEDIFETQAGGAVQTLSAETFTAYNTVGMSFNHRGWFFSLDARADVVVDWMNSELSPFGTEQAVRAADFLCNDIFRQEYKIAAQPSVFYRFNQKFSVSAGSDIGYLAIRQNDRLRQETDRVNRLYASPHLSVKAQLTPEVSLSLYGLYDEKYGGLYNDYYGYIMSNYRYISSTGGELPLYKNQNYGLTLAYASAPVAAFANLKGSYWKSWKSVTYGTVYEGTLTRLESVDEPSRSHGFRVSADFSKLLFAISTTMKLAASYSRSWNTLYRQNDLYNSRMDQIVGKFSFNTQFCSWLSLDYGASAARSGSHTDLGGSMSPINSLRQKAILNFSLGENTFLKVGGEHYYNDAVSGDKSMFFTDASLSWRHKRVDLDLECRNLLGSDLYSSAVYNDITTYVYTYELRPLTVLLKVRFNY